MDYSNLDLRHKTFLDFTSDGEIIEEVIGGNTLADKSRFLLSVAPDINRLWSEALARTYMEFAELTPDKELKQSIEKEFSKEFESSFNE